MSGDLYFIPILARALERPDSRRALSEAFAKIEKTGTQRRYANGHKNFELFIAAARFHYDATQTDHVHKLIVELAAGTLVATEEEKRLLSMTINSHPEWKSEYEAMYHQQVSEDNMRSSYPVIEVMINTGMVGAMHFEELEGRESVDGISPADYSLRLANTGWTIWAGRLTAKDLIWAEAYGTKDLDLAAATEDMQRHPTREIVLLGGNVILRIFPGIEGGSMEVELTV